MSKNSTYPEVGRIGNAIPTQPIPRDDVSAVFGTLQHEKFALAMGFPKIAELVAALHPNLRLENVEGVTEAGCLLFNLRSEYWKGGNKDGANYETVIRSQLELLEDEDKTASLLLGWLDSKPNMSPNEAARTAPRLALEWELAVNQSKAAEPRFIFKTLSQLEAEPDPEWLIHGFLTEGGTSLLTAKHGSYKSFFALEMALCIACGIPFHGHEVKSGRVIYDAAEGASGIKKRAKAWCLHHQQDPGDNFQVLDVPLQIHDEITRVTFTQEIAELKPALIVLDTLARCAVGLDENNAGDMGRFVDALGGLAKQTNAHVMTVHHNAKGGDYRGSTAIPAAVDTHITLTKGDGKNASVTLEMPKQKDFEALYPIIFEPREVPFLYKGKSISSLIFEKAENATGQGERASDTERKVLDALQKIATETGVPSSQWKAASDEYQISNGAFYAAVKRLHEPLAKGGLGLVSIISGQAGKRGALYAPSLQIAPIGAMEQSHNLNHSTLQSLHSPVGSGVMERSESEQGKSNGVRQRSKPTNAADSEPYNGQGDEARL